MTDVRGPTIESAGAARVRLGTSWLSVPKALGETELVGNGVVLGLDRPALRIDLLDLPLELELEPPQPASVTATASATAETMAARTDLLLIIN